MRVAQARALLKQAPLPTPAVALASEPDRVCPHCGSTRLVLIEVVPRIAAMPPRALDSS
jgi:hypothetical protein